MKWNRDIYLFIVLFSIFALLVTGCGGGGGGDSSSAISLKTSTIRTMKQGDTWYYTGSGTWSDGTNTVNISGTGTTQILSSTKQSPITLDNCLDQYTVLNLTTPS